MMGGGIRGAAREVIAGATAAVESGVFYPEGSAKHTFQIVGGGTATVYGSLDRAAQVGDAAWFTIGEFTGPDDVLTTDFPFVAAYVDLTVVDSGPVDVLWVEG